MSAPQVYHAIAAVTAALSKAGIQKKQTNEQEGYRFRGIDDVYDHLSPLLAENRLCILPRSLERERIERSVGRGGPLVNVCLRVAYDFVSAEDGSTHTMETYGEALDAGDKATSKAMSAAFKSAVLQAFCIPIGSRDDADAESPNLRSQDAPPEPARGWERWASDVMGVARVCEDDEELNRLQTSNRELLKAIALERRDLYEQIGQAVRLRRAALRPKPAKRGARMNGIKRAAKGAAEANGESHG